MTTRPAWHELRRQTDFQPFAAQAPRRNPARGLSRGALCCGFDLARGHIAPKVVAYFATVTAVPSHGARALRAGTYCVATIARQVWTSNGFNAVNSPLRVTR